jgi:hypothetical protein
MRNEFKGYIFFIILKGKNTHFNLNNSFMKNKNIELRDHENRRGTGLYYFLQYNF